ELRSLTSEHRRILSGLQRSYSDILRRIIERGMAIGTFEVLDSRLTTIAIQQMLIGTFSWYKPGERLTESDLIATCTILALRMLGVSMVHSGVRSKPGLSAVYARRRGEQTSPDGASGGIRARLRA
ncbi:MAG TPA: hypothetical protein VGH29_09665, partial [Candidatus Binataceae bacterium]